MLAYAAGPADARRELSAWERVKGFFGFHKEEPVVVEKPKVDPEAKKGQIPPFPPHMYGMYGPPFGMMGDYGAYYDQQGDDEKQGDSELK